MPVSRMWALKVTRSTMAATRRGSGKTVPHSLKGKLVAIATEARSSRSVMIWNSNSAPRGSIWTYPSSSTYADFGIDRSIPTS